MPPPGSMPFEPLLLVAGLIVVAAAGLAGRPRPPAAAPPHRALLLGGAALLLIVCWASPLQTLAAHYLLTAHLAQVMILMGAIPPLLLLALPRAGTVPLPRHVRAAGRVLVHPFAGILAVNAALFGWHVSAAYDLSLRSPSLYAAQQVSLLLASLMFWWPIVVPFGGRRVLSRWATLGYILIATIPQTFAGITVALAKHAMYPAYAAAPRLLGLSVMTDQQIAGACTALVSKVALFTAFSVVFMRMLSDPSGEGPDDGGGGGGGRRPRSDLPNPQPSGSVPWLADINAGRTVPEPVPVPRRLRVPAGSTSRRE